MILHGFFDFFSNEEERLEPSLKLSKYFNVADLSGTSTGIDNRPPISLKPKLINMAQTLDFLYDKVGPFRVVSSYRSKDVNDEVGGSPTSRHLAGDAADITPTTMGAEEFWANILRDDELKNSFGHIAYKKHQGNLHITLPFMSDSKGFIQAVPQIADNYPTTGVLYMTATDYDIKNAFAKYFGDAAPERIAPIIAGGGGINWMAFGFMGLSLAALAMVIRKRKSS